MNRFEDKMKTPSLWSVITNESALTELCQFLPSITIRLRKVNKGYLEFFHDEKLSQLLPAAFEKLGLFYTNPFIHCKTGDCESVWLMLVHGVDPFLSDPVR